MRSEKDLEAPVDTAVGATMGLLAFILAFNFGLTASRFDARRELLLNEVIFLRLLLWRRLQQSRPCGCSGVISTPTDTHFG